jgi:hypothetical protein
MFKLIYTASICYRTILLLFNYLENRLVSKFSYHEHNLIHLCPKL